MLPVTDHKLHSAHKSRVNLAAFAIELDCEVAATDSDFARFPKLKWRTPPRLIDLGEQGDGRRFESGCVRLSKKATFYQPASTNRAL
jgi:hypothetical protein